MTSRRDLFRKTAKAATVAASTFSIVKAQSVSGTQANSALTLGLIGCGGRGMYVSGIFAKNEFLKVTGFCDIYQDKLDAAGKRYSGAKSYTKYQELLASDVDAVLIATPAYLHPEHFEAAVKAKKHIFLEKPAGDVKQARPHLAPGRAGRPDGVLGITARSFWGCKVGLGGHFPSRHLFVCHTNK